MLALPVLIGLGVWQLQRADFKEALLADYARRAMDAPIVLDGRQPWDPSMLYRRATAFGTYVGERQFLLDNRTHRGQAGYHVITPLRTSEAAWLLVNRGWVPVGGSRQELPDLPVPAVPVEVDGILMVSERDAPVLGPEEPALGWPRVIQRVDFPSLAGHLGTAVMPYILQLDADAEGGFIREWRPFYGGGPEKHRAYALQWFGIALVLLVLYVSSQMTHGNERATPRGSNQ
jgi:surfeit locus 1 family protein